MGMIDTVGAFCPHGLVERQDRETGPLVGLSFGLKDLFDLAGTPTGAGNPDWLATHPVPDMSAPLAETLLAAGARLVGKTQTDEMAWSLNGENAHYGTPRNVAAPGRIPGGSSSGSAAATAAGLVDFAIGTDTGGSVRLPASYCGLYGLRPSHGRIPLLGAVPLAPSYDTAGWFARDPEMLARVGRVLLGETPPQPRPRRLLIAGDLFERAGRAVTEALHGALEGLRARFATVETITLVGEAAEDWRNAFRLIQSSEAWAAHGAWVTRVQPRFGPGVRERFEAARQLDADAVAAAVSLRRIVAADLRARLGADTILALPSAPGIAPRLATPEADLDEFRARALELLCPAGHAGLPQISLPLGQLDGCPLGLSLIAGPGRDETLLDLARETAG
ncbi:amidase [Methylobacterium soli]|uniref:Amidase n=2 Tax=Methylobacterium soli TaxID=553447 RepID=A0A6L3SZ84_9HYPH|nr:amidase [Methylobacterium soli]